jgi:hypothetical protein
MGDEAPAEEEPLLVEDTHAVWDAIEDGSNRNPALNIKQLINDDPDHVIKWLANKGVTKLGDFKIQVQNCWPTSKSAHSRHSCSKAFTTECEEV